MGAGVCKPTWVVPSVDDRHLYIPCNGRGEVLEIERQSMEVTRTFATGAGPYNADVSADGQHLVVSLKGNQAIAVIDLKSGTVTQVATTQPVTHGVAVTPDSRYAFVTNEAVGAVRGTVDIFDIGSKELVASVEVQYQPGGIAFWKMEKPDPSR
jgi:DNA-binding beta-propeller fold protein YncE